MLSETYFKMFGDYCRQVNLVSPTHSDEFPYELRLMIPCTNPDHKHENTKRKID